MNRIAPGVLMVLLAILSASASAQKIAFLDVEKVIQDYNLTREISERLGKRLAQERELLNQQKAKLQTEVEALKDEKFERDDPASMLQRLKRERDLRLKQVELDNNSKKMAVIREKEIVDHTKKVYAQILREVESYAGEHPELSAVFLLTKRSFEETVRRDEVISDILIRGVLWHDHKLDITNAIVNRLNR